MGDKLTVCAVQSTIIWENLKANRIKLDAVFESINSDQIDLVVFPETFVSGFTMNPKSVAETMNGQTVKWLKQHAAKGQFLIIGSMVIQEQQKFYNRLMVIYPDQRLEYYDKRHLFSLANEDQFYEKGERRMIISYKGFKICPLICYDLRFPVFSRNNDQSYDVLIYVANWPKPRINAWKILLSARAIENLSYVVGVNRIGKDDDEVVYTGDSQIIDPLGHVLVAAKNSEQPEILTYQLELDTIKAVRNKFNFLNDMDQFELKG